jgi:Uma2 family endonuclease
MHVAVKIPQVNYFSDDELWELCRANPELRIERDENGLLIIMPPTGIESSFRNSDLNFEIQAWNRRTRLGKVSDSNGGYTLPDASMRAPDVAWVSNERLSSVSPEDLKKFAHVCPNFVIELLSETDHVEELQQKMEKWIQNGVQLGWLIDPKSRQTHVYEPNSTVSIHSFEEALTGKDILPDFSLTLAGVFG